MIPFNKPYLAGNEVSKIIQSLKSGMLSGNGYYTQKCQSFFENRYGFKKCLLTTSCTDALEMCALLLDIRPGDEVIVPSYTFVSTALAFARQGAKIIFAESSKSHPGIDEDLIEPLITSRTKAIVPVHYAGIACNMDKLLDIAARHNVFIVEDAAQAINSYYADKPLGSIGNLGCFSFHETKNIHCGEGGMLVINDERFIKRAEIIWEKGTNRAEFFRGEADRYGWKDTGSSFLPADFVAAFLYGQIEKIAQIQERRMLLWNSYYNSLQALDLTDKVSPPFIPAYSSNNAHMFYIVCKINNKRDALIHHLKKHDIMAVSHYLPLHQSSYYSKYHDGRVLTMSSFYSNNLLRLPLFHELTEKDTAAIVNSIKSFFSN